MNDYIVTTNEDGYLISRGEDELATIPWDDVRIYVDDETLIESWLAGAF